MSEKTFKHYQKWADTYDQVENSLTLMVDGFLRENLGSLKDKAAIEFGCGTGRNLVHLKRLGADPIVGVDYSDQMLRRARLKDPSFQFIQGSLEDQGLALRDDFFDMGLVALVFEHFSKLDSVFQCAARALKDSAALWVCELHPELHSKGVSAFFLDENGEKIFLESHPHTKKEFLKCGGAWGFKSQEIHEWAPSGEMIEKNPRLEKYRHLPTLLSFRFNREAR
jgi:malonyl-CoA O-methyltransferase